MTKVHVRGLECYAYHGVPDEEQVIGHRYLIDIEAEVAETACVNDQISGTVNYVDLAQAALVVMKEQNRTVEHVASRVADAVLSLDQRIDAVTVKIEKPLPPAPIIAAAVGVTLCRRR